MTTRHPELAAEQKVVHHTHDCHESSIQEQRAIVEGRMNGGGDPRAQHAIREAALKRLADLEAVETARLVVGRLDFEDERSFYIGPCQVMDGSKVAVVDFTMPIARGFYHAS